MPREQHSSQQGGDISHAINDVHILLSWSLLPFVFIFYACANVKWGNELQTIPYLSAQQNPFHTRLSWCIEYSLACYPVLFPSLNKCTNPCKSCRACQEAAQYSDLALGEPSRAQASGQDCAFSACPQPAGQHGRHVSPTLPFVCLRAASPQQAPTYGNGDPSVKPSTVRHLLSRA